MKTLIELYDERPLENVLSTEVFSPERTVFICPPEVGRDTRLQQKLREYFAHRGVQAELEFVTASLLDASAVAKHLREVVARYSDCALDIAGGTDAALFAAGLLCANVDIPVFTYSRKRNTFFDIRGAAFARDLPCQVRLRVEDCFLMAGGAMRTGRVDNAVLARYAELIPQLYLIYMKYRRQWNGIVTYIQRISQGQEVHPTLLAQGAYQVKAPQGGRVQANPDALRDMQSAGLIDDLSISEQEGVRFSFRDAQVRAWLRDVGSALELHIYQSCRALGVFDDVRTSVVVDWQGGNQPDAVTNEIDVMATCGVRPIFISCKTCDVKTEALNELAILRDRFGGQIARAAIVTAERGRAPMRHRAMELGIDVIDLEDLQGPDLARRLKALSR